MPEDILPPDDSTTPHSSSSGREVPREPTPFSPSPGPPAWASAPDPHDETAQPPNGGRYRALAFHRRGGMGQVWRAQDSELDREVAFKVIRPRYADDETARRRFVFEAEVTSRLAHPAVIPVYGFGRDEAGRPYYAMRFIEGQSLQEAIAAFHGPDGPTGAERIVALRRLLGHFVTVCRSVDYAHSRGIIHRDLKPGNVMVGAYGETLVVDWGIAKRLRTGAGEVDAAPPVADEPDTQADPTRSLRGSKLGSPGYWSPEQAAGHTELHNERTDVYGLGAILFAILTGVSPHPTGTHPAQPPGPRAVGSGVDAGIDEITRTAMAIRQADRYSSAAELALAIERWLADQPVAAQRGAVNALSRQAESDPGDHALAEQLARQRANLGLMFAGMGRDVNAVAELRAAADGFSRLATERAKPRFLADQANCLLALARALGALGQVEDARAAEREAGALYRRLIAARPDEYKTNLADIMLTWAGAPPPAAAELTPAPEHTGDGDDSVSVDYALGTVAGTDDIPQIAPPARTAASTDADPTPSAATAPDDAESMKTLPPLDAPARQLSEEELNLTGGYTLLGELARSGMGVLYLARDNALGRQVVIKALHDYLVADQYVRSRFLQEMHITASLEHPNLVRAYTHGVRDDGTPFLVMEYLNGVTLLRLLNMHGPGWGADYLDPLAQACDGLHYAHSRGIIHRDAKLSNVIVTTTGRAALLDWGIAKVSGQPEATRPKGDGPADIRDLMLTRDGAIVGTPAYMAPEQALGNLDAIGPRTDVFTVGANIFHLATGRSLGWGANAADVINRMTTGDLPRLRDVRPDVPAKLDVICTRALAYRPEDRYPTAAALAADLRAFLANPTRRRWWQLWG